MSSDCRLYEVPVPCSGMVCRAVYERAADGDYAFVGVDHLFEVGEDYETRREPAEEWGRRFRAGLEYAPTTMTWGIA